MVARCQDGFATPRPCARRLDALEGVRLDKPPVDCPAEGGMQLDPRFLVDFGDLRGHQVRLEGGDASSDSYCYA